MLVLVGAMFLPYPSFPGHGGMIPCGGWQGFCVTAALIRFKNYRWSDRPGVASSILAGTERKIWIAIAFVLVIAYWSPRVSPPGRVWTFVHKVATERIARIKASATTATICKRYFKEAWAKREKDLWGVKIHQMSEVVAVGCFSWQPLWV